MIRYEYMRLDFGDNTLRNLDRVVMTSGDAKWCLSDERVLRIYFEISKGNGEFEGLDIPAGAVLELGAKSIDVYDGNLLIYSGPDKWNVSGDWAEVAPTTGMCSVRVDLHTKQLLEKFTTATKEIEINVDVVITIPGHRQMTVQFKKFVINDVLKLDQGEAAEANPDFQTVADVNAAITAVTVPAEGFYKIVNGKLYLYDVALLDYFPVALNSKAFVILEE